MAKSIGIVASATHRFALDTWNKLDTIMKSGRLTNVAKIAGVSSSQLDTTLKCSNDFCTAIACTIESASASW